MPEAGVRFAKDERVMVKTVHPGPNRRTPGYLRGRTGVVIVVHGRVPDYAHDHGDDWGPLYSIIFDLDDSSHNGRKKERVVADIHESWLERA